MTEQFIELKSLLSCPVQWREVIRKSVNAPQSDDIGFAAPVVALLECYWCEFVRTFSIEQEADYARYFNAHLNSCDDAEFDCIDWRQVIYTFEPQIYGQFSGADVISIGGEIAYVKEWIDTASDQYRSRFSCLREMKIDDPRRKHVIVGATQDETLAKAKPRRSLFFPQFYDGIPRLLWHAMRSFWCDVNPGHHFYRIVDCGFAVGATNYQKTSLVRFDVQSSNVHAYPIGRDELNDIPESVDDPELVFGVHEFEWS